MMAKFNIKNNCITPKNKSYYLMSAFAVIILIIINYFRLTMHSEVLVVYSGLSRNVLILLWFDFLYYSIIGTIIYMDNGFQSRNAVSLVIELQHALRMINIKTKMMYYLKIWNWIYILSILFMYIVYDISSRIISYINITYLIFMVPVLNYDLNVLRIKNSLFY